MQSDQHALSTTAHHSTDTDAPASTVAHMLDRIGAEIARAADDMRDLQEVLSPLLSERREPSVMMQIQNIDLLEQTLRDLETVIVEIASMPSVAQPLDMDAITKLCKLADLAKRFCNMPTDLASTDVELF